jgi:hypothetical protein
VSSRLEHLLSMEVDGWDNDRTEGSSSHVWWHRRVDPRLSVIHH